MADNGKKERNKEKGKGKGKGKGGGQTKVEVPELLKSDDVTGQYKEGSIVMRIDLPDQYQQAFNDAWNAVRMSKLKQFKTAVDNLIRFSVGTPAESAPLDVYCDKANITFGDLEKKVEHRMCLLAWCGFHCRLEFAEYLLKKGASIDSGDSRVGSPLLQMMVLHEARPAASQLTTDVLRFFTETYHSVLSRVISTTDDPVTYRNASVLTVALHMKRLDVAKYFFTEHKLHPIFCGSRDYPPVFLEYMEYGTFNFIPWLLTDGYDTIDEIINFIDEAVQRGVQEAGLGEGGQVQPGTLAAAAERTKRVVAHAMLLCANRRGINFFTKKRPDLIKAVDRLGRTALYIAAEVGCQKPVNILCDKCGELIWVKDRAGALPLLAAAKAGHKRAVERLLFHMLRDNALKKSPSVELEIKYTSLTAISNGYHTYFEAFHNKDVQAYEVSALNLTLDVTGNTAAHIAALKGREEMFKALLPTTTADMIAILTKHNGEGKSPLQLAVERGHSGVFETLPAKQTEWREKWKAYNDALLLYACVHGNVESVKAIMHLGSSSQICSPKGRTPLSCAAEAGNYDIVNYLLACRNTTEDGRVLGTCPEGSGVKEWSPLLLAARNGHAKVCRRLLAKGAKVNRPRDPVTNFTPLMVAIDEGNRDVVITILSDETQGMDAMRVCVSKPSCNDTVDITTPMRMLIEEMPDVAEWIMNRSIYCSSGQGVEDLSLTEGGRSTVVEYSFQFLEDFQEECPKFPFHGMNILNYMNSPTRRQLYRQSVREPLTLDLDDVASGNGGHDAGEKAKEMESSPLATAPETAADEEISPATVQRMDTILERPSTPTLLVEGTMELEGVVRTPRYHANDWGPLQYNRHHHPLHIMVKHKRAELLKHPLVVQLLKYKWGKVALPLFLAYISVYLVFVLMLTLFALLSPRPSPDSDTCVLNSRDSEIITQKTNGTCDGLNVAKVDYLYGSSVFLILLSLLYLAVELVQVVRRRKQYFTEGENYVQVLTFVFSIIFVSGFGNECWCAPPWQWQFGALALFLAWFNLVILLKDMPFTGIPINMLFNICLTFVKLVFLPVLLILSFALPFYMLFVRDINSIEGDDAPGTLTAFLNPPRALAKTVMQTAGELDFETIFNGGDLLYSPSAYLLFIAFVVIMPILFSNLLVGLAVGDTAEEKDKATFTRTRLQVEFILELEAMSAFLRGLMRPSENRRRYGKKVNKVHLLYQKLMGLDYNAQVELVRDLREKDADFVDTLNETGPTHELQVRVEGLSVKMVKVEEDVRAVRDDVGGVEGRLGDRLLKVEESLHDVRGLLEQLVALKTHPQTN